MIPDSATSFWPDFSTWLGLSVEPFPLRHPQFSGSQFFHPKHLFNSKAPEIIKESHQWGLLVSLSSKPGTTRPSWSLATGATQWLFLIHTVTLPKTYLPAQAHNPAFHPTHSQKILLPISQEIGPMSHTHTHPSLPAYPTFPPNSKDKKSCFSCRGMGKPKGPHLTPWGICSLAYQRLQTLPLLVYSTTFLNIFTSLGTEQLTRTSYSMLRSWDFCLAVLGN